MKRFPELPPQLDQRQQEIYDRIASGPRGGVRGPLAYWLYSPDLAERAQALGEFLRYNSMFPPKLSEFIILIVARHYDCQYEWSAHAPIAASSGVPADVIEAVGSGRQPKLDDPDLGIIYPFVRSLISMNDVPDADFDAFRARFGERGVVEAAAIMGYYAVGAFTLNAVRFPPKEGLALPARTTDAIASAPGLQDK